MSVRQGTEKDCQRDSTSALQKHYTECFTFGICNRNFTNKNASSGKVREMELETLLKWSGLVWSGLVDQQKVDRWTAHSVIFDTLEPPAFPKIWHIMLCLGARRTDKGVPRGLR